MAESKCLLLFLTTISSSLGNVGWGGDMAHLNVINDTCKRLNTAALCPRVIIFPQEYLKEKVRVHWTAWPFWEWLSDISRIVGYLITKVASLFSHLYDCPVSPTWPERIPLTSSTNLPRTQHLLQKLFQPFNMRGAVEYQAGLPLASRVKMFPKR